MKLDVKAEDDQEELILAFDSAFLIFNWRNDYWSNNAKNLQT